MSERICANPDCGKVLVRREGERSDKWRDRRSCNISCGSRAAAKAAVREKRAGRTGGGDQSWRYTGWPTVTGEIDWNNAFAKGNVQTNDGGPFRMMRPVNHSPSGSAAAWMMEWARG